MTKESDRNKNQIIDLVKFGQSLAENRRLAGYKNTEALSEAIARETGEYISGRTLYRIEHGETVITLPQLLAIGIVVDGLVLSGILVEQINDAVSESVNQLERETLERQRLEFLEAKAEHDRRIIRQLRELGHEVITIDDVDALWTEFISTKASEEADSAE